MRQKKIKKMGQRKATSLCIHATVLQIIFICLNVFPREKDAKVGDRRDSMCLLDSICNCFMHPNWTGHFD